jgi:hypothetical protein
MAEVEAAGFEGNLNRLLLRPGWLPAAEETCIKSRQCTI